MVFCNKRPCDIKLTVAVKGLKTKKEIIYTQALLKIGFK